MRPKGKNGKRPFGGQTGQRVTMTEFARIISSEVDVFHIHLFTRRSGTFDITDNAYMQSII